MKTNLFKPLIILPLIAILASCNIPKISNKAVSNHTPAQFPLGGSDTANTAITPWKSFFKDSLLISLIDTALKNNQELNITLQEINIAKNEIRSKKGAYLPFLHAGTAANVEKVGRYTSQGANDANTEIMPGKKFPDPLSDYYFGLQLSWELDIWKKLRNAKTAAIHRYLASVEGKNFMVTHLVSEIADTYYELISLDNQLSILKQNIEIQQNALSIVKLEKISARVTELAVKKFEAEVLKNQSHQYFLMQQIVETENHLNFLLGRYPTPIARNSNNFANLKPENIQVGIASQLLINRPDIRKASEELAATHWELKSAKAEFYPSLMLLGGLGYQAFNPKYLIQSPESMLYNMAGEFLGPLINRNAIKANFLNANSKQIQAAYQFDQTYLKAFIEVSNQLSKLNNLKTSFDLKAQQVEALTQSIDISTTLFKSARADYMEVLMTQRDALESKFDLIELKKQQMNSMIDLYQALGGGWR